MKNLFNVLTAISIFAVVNCASTASFAQKHSKKAHSDNYSSAPSRSYSNYSNNSNEGDWKFGADFGMTLSHRSTSITGTTDQTLLMFGSLSGFAPFLNMYADYSISDKVGIQAKIGWDNNNESATTTIAVGKVRADITKGIHNSGIGIGLAIRFDLSKQFFMTAGPRIVFALGNGTRTDDTKITGMQDVHSEEEGDAKTIVGLEAGAGYRIELSRSMSLIPRANVQLFPSVGTAGSVGDIQVSSSTVVRFQMSCGLMMSL